jgi:superfamily I DNA/RNA helicase
VEHRELGIKGNLARKAKPDEELDRIGIRGTLDERLKTIQRLDKTGKSEPGTVKLVSMHGSKGLEFEHVWLIGLDDKTMPGGLKEHEVKEEGMDEWLENQEEERRLLYVGITRAKDVLHLSWARIPPISIVDMNNENKKTSKPKPPSSECRFLVNLPANLRPRESRSQSLNTKIGVETM